MKLKKSVSGYAIPIEYIEYIARKAVEEGRSRSDVMTRILNEYFEMKGIKFE